MHLPSPFIRLDQFPFTKKCGSVAVGYIIDGSGENRNARTVVRFFVSDNKHFDVPCEAYLEFFEATRENFETSRPASLCFKDAPLGQYSVTLSQVGNDLCMDFIDKNNPRHNRFCYYGDKIVGTFAFWLSTMVSKARYAQDVVLCVPSILDWIVDYLIEKCGYGETLAPPATRDDEDPAWLKCYEIFKEKSVNLDGPFANEDVQGSCSNAVSALVYNHKDYLRLLCFYEKRRRDLKKNNRGFNNVKKQ